MTQLIRTTEHPHSIPAIRFEIRHQIAGRIRIRITSGMSPEPLDTIASMLHRIDGIWKIRINPRCACLVLHHHPERAIGYTDIAMTLGLLPEPILGQTGRAARLTTSRSRWRLRNRMPARQKSGSSTRLAKRTPPRRPPDCRLCQLKLSAARWMMKDLWRCWRNDVRRRWQIKLDALRWRMGLR